MRILVSHYHAVAASGAVLRCGHSPLQHVHRLDTSRGQQLQRGGGRYLPVYDDQLVGVVYRWAILLVEGHHRRRVLVCFGGNNNSNDIREYTR